MRPEYGEFKLKQKPLVSKSNDIIDASYRLSLNEQRLILMCIAQIKKGQMIDKNSSFTVRAQGFARAFNLSETDCYKELQIIAERLYERSATINNPDPVNPKLTHTKTRWISSIDYFPGEGELVITFASKMIPYISMLEGRFTQYSIDSISGMKSTYGVRFYELFKKWNGENGKTKTVKEISIQELKAILDIEDKYKIFRDLRNKVLNPAIRDVNTHSDLSASYTQHKTGRRITHLIFKFNYKPQHELSLSEAPTPKRLTKAYVEQHAHPGESYQQARDRLTRTRQTA